MENETNTGKNGSFVKGAVIGGVIGAAAALLLAPKPGHELRSDIAGGFRKASDKTKQLASDLKTRMQGVTQSFMEQTTDKMDKLADAGHDALDKIKSAEQATAAKANGASADHQSRN